MHHIPHLLPVLVHTQHNHLTHNHPAPTAPLPYQHLPVVLVVVVIGKQHTIYPSIKLIQFYSYVPTYTLGPNPGREYYIASSLNSAAALLSPRHTKRKGIETNREHAEGRFNF
jgi:hypothetical protein